MNRVYEPPPLRAGGVRPWMLGLIGVASFFALKYGIWAYFAFVVWAGN